MSENNYTNLTAKQSQVFMDISNKASNAFIEVLKEVEDNKDLSTILWFTHKVCRKIDELEAKGAFITPRSLSWFKVIKAWLYTKKSEGLK